MYKITDLRNVFTSKIQIKLCVVLILVYHLLSDEKDKLAMAAALAPSAGGNEGNPAVNGETVAPASADTIDEPIDENLFAGEDLDLVEEELETLDLVD